MKKRVMSILLLAAMLFALLPTAFAADNRTYVKAMDLNIELPKAGMTQYEGQELKLLSAKTPYGDLAAGGAVTLLKITWKGEFDKTDRANPKFQAGMSYIATIQIHFVYEKGYVANHQIINNNYHMDSELFKVTVNGVAAETQEGSPGNPTVKVNLAVPAPEMSEEEKNAAAAARREKFDLRHAALRAITDAYTTAEADGLWVEKQGYGTLILNDSTLPDPLYQDKGYVAGDFADGKKNEFYLKDRTLNIDYVTGLVIDFDFARFVNDYQAENFTKNHVFLYDNLKEIWLSDKVDAVEFLKHLKSATEGNGTKLDKWYWTNSTSFGTADATLYISAAAEKVRAAYASAYGYITPCFSIKVYDGDVYTAWESGTARDYCTSHVYKAVIMAADRIANLADCVNAPCWYYSCSVCGKCEYNDKHTINRDYVNKNEVPKADHDYWLRLATDEAYVGVNAADDRVYWYSCIYCGKPYNYHQKHLTEQDMINAGGSELTFSEWNARKISTLKQRETDALNRTTSEIGMFVLSAKSDAKTSAWAQSDVNHALDNHLLDTALLGNDYTKPISRLQFCSVAVRMAEELIGKEISPAASGIFTDTDHLYVRKAYAAGITSGVSPTEFDPSGTLNRQQMATFIYRALQYVAANADYAYTDYDSKLSTYVDRHLIDSWATESMAFMNALDLIKGVGDSCLDPRGTCTVEQAVAVASRSIYAHQIGWYQATENVRYQYGAGGLDSYITLVKGDRIWVTGGRLGSGVDDTSLDNAKGGYRSGSTYLPVVEPFTGETCYISGSKLKPIRN